MSDRLRIYLFGEPRFEFRGAPNAFKAPPKTLPLLAYLLLHRRGPIARETVAVALWPDDDQAAAFGNLRRHLHYLSKALPEPPADAPWILADKKSIGWNAQSPYWLDVEAFETESQDRQLRAHAVRLYAGDLYERCSEEWIDFERERLRTLQISNLAQLCAEARERSSYIEALQYAQLMLAADPWREDAVRAIMETRMLLGDRAGALAEYERFASRLQAELQTSPLAETSQTYQRIAQSLQAAAAQSPARAAASELVGRRNELATLRDEWQRAARGEGRVVFLGGEAGIGKTTLLAALRNAVLETGGTVFTAASSAQEETAYAAFLGVAHDAGVDLIATVSNDDERLRMFESFAAALEARSKQHPLLLAVEDMHWAGTATLDLLRYLILRLSNAPVLLVATYREFELTRGHPLRALRRQILKMQRCTSLALSSLDREEVRELARTRAGRHLSDDFIGRIYERSDGNPLFVIELVREMQDGRHDRIPSSIAEIVNERSARLAPRARSLVQTAALAGSSFSAELLSQVTGLREGDVLAQLDELVAAHFLRQTEDDNAFSFVHEVIREAVADAVDPAGARSVHVRVGRALRDLHAEHFSEIAAAVAWHYESAGIPEEAADAYLAAAEHALSVYAIEEAASYAGKALEHARTGEDRFRALLVLESVYGRQADRARQRQCLADLLDVSNGLGPEQRAQATLREADFSGGEPVEQQRDALTRFQALLAESPQYEPAYLLRRGEYLSRVGEAHEARHVLEQSLERLSVSDDPDSVVRCLTALYLVCVSTGDPLSDIEQRINLARASLERKANARIAARLGFIQAGATIDRDPVLAAEYAARMLENAVSAGDVWLEALAHLSSGACATRQMLLGVAHRHLQRYAQIATAAGRTRDFARACSWQLMVANRCADFLAAERYGEQGLQAAIAAGAADIRANLVANLANTAVWAGDLDTGEARLREALALGEQRGYAQPSVSSLLGEVLIGKGNLHEGIDRIERAWAQSSPQEDALGVERVHVPLITGLAYAAASRTEDAERCAQTIRAQLSAFETYYIHPQAYLWAAAQLLNLRGYHDDAAVFLQAARRRRDEVLANIDDEATRESFRRFAFNQFIENGTLVEDPLHAWFLPYEDLPSLPHRRRNGNTLSEHHLPFAAAAREDIQQHSGANG